jgi:YVTN family beta-propeller protein
MKNKAKTAKQRELLSRSMMQGQRRDWLTCICYRVFSLIVFSVALAILTSCQAKPLSIRPALEDEGEIFLYLEPLPQEAERLSFTLEEIAAVKDDGSKIPLTLSLPEIKLRDVMRQRCFASGPLPPGTYRGLSVKVRKAALRTEEGEAALSVDEEASLLAAPFSITRTKATELSLALQYRQSISGEVRFVPVFSVSVAGRPLAGVTAFASSRFSNDVALIDKQEGRISGMIATGSGPAGMAIDQLRGRVYVALSGDDAVDVIDASVGGTIGRIHLRSGDAPEELALVPGGRTLLAANAGSDTVSFIDTGSLSEAERVSVGQDPVSLLIDGSGRRAFVFNKASSTISVLDIQTGAVVATVSTEPEPLRGQFNRRGDRLYVLCGRSRYLTVIDPQSLNLIRREYLGREAGSIKVDTRTDMLYIGWKLDDEVTVYDPLSFQPVDRIPTDGTVTYMTIDGDENNLYLVIPVRKTVRAVNLVSRKTAFEIDFCANPTYVAVMGER